MICKRVGFSSVFLILLSGLGHGASANAQQPSSQQEIIMATPIGEGQFTHYLGEVYQDLGRRIGLKFSIEEVPKKRALVSANQGKFIDGVASRIRGLEKMGFPNLRMANSPIVSVQHVVFAKRREIAKQINSVDSLIKSAANSGFLVGYLRGSKKAEKLLAKLPEENRYKINHVDDAFLRLDKNRLGAFIGGPGMVSRALLNGKYKDSGIVEVAVLSETPLFPYLHFKHADLIPGIQKALREMKKDGTLEKLRNAAQSTSSRVR